ncbi:MULTISPECIES: twin-arginine translocase subunit TatC [unclassified Aeromicrobium]|uniref:twin-arginine translocase subunit TatC n=1 Tax=unclassified Aeromicrobium TaxID=2633570 RepID=UPI002097CE8B|nr:MULTISPECIES: twin-arginine translocase subunit TatC [unclassified Aeromicrobium]MCO7238755.1 twin-arginine translocase subunit TatC [Aeromicrobium sp. CnD17-E]MDR6119507.1 sec-independent protein translocase protein TatC [Aeromicrobium sp. SORGH_AS_0981]
MASLSGAPSGAAGGTMPLVEHLRELRSRLTRAVIAIAVFTILGLVFYAPILNFLTHPYNEMRPLLEREGIDTQLIITGVGGAFQYQLKISLVFGLLASSPFWLWQIWAFVLPALHRHEKRWALLLAGTGAPLFIGGAALAYVVLPKAMEILIGFVPDGFGSLVTGAEYFDFIVKMMLVFGVAAEIPLVVVLLNRLGLVSAKQLASARPWTIIGIFVFAAIATPTTDPLTMLFLAVPMTILYLISEVIAKLTDRRRGRERVDETADDDASPLDGPSELEGPSSVDD